jgi:hypothetical protein
MYDNPKRIRNISKGKPPDGNRPAAGVQKD